MFHLVGERQLQLRRPPEGEAGVEGHFASIPALAELRQISEKNGFLLEVEGIHMNIRGGMMIADQIEAFLLGNPRM